MIRRSSPNRVRYFTTTVAVALAVVVTTDPAAARRDRQYRERPVSDVIENTIAGPPIMAVVSIKDQRVSLYDAHGGALRARVSSGRTDYETPVGIYSVLEKEEEHYSNVYDDASMPFMQRITWSGIALHAGVLPGYPASHGCVRLPNGFAEQIFPLTKVGMRVVIARDDVTPVTITDPNLPKPAPLPVSATTEDAPVAIPMAYDDSGNEQTNGTPFMPDIRAWPARQAQLDSLRAIAAEKASEVEPAAERAEELKRPVLAEQNKRAKIAKALKWAEQVKKAAEDKLKRAEAAFADARKPSQLKYWDSVKTKAATAKVDADTKLATAAEKLRQADEAVAAANKEYLPAEAARVAAAATAKEAKRRTLPISLFVSLKTKRLYVRQGYEPVFDVPVTIADPDKPIGTNVFTAVDFVDQGKDVRWTVVSPNRRIAELIDRTRTRTRTDAVSPPPADVVGAKAALARVTLPPEVMARLSGSVWPGSSLIISDEEQSRETGKSTDFIVLISGEPQGGLKKRPKQTAPSSNFYRDSADGYFYGDNGRVYDRNGRPMRYVPQKSFFGFW
jgi:hypothetical protein